jgi:UDP-glucose 4-epimerase
MKKILVTGGAGFIGSHLVEKLVKKKHKVTVIDNLSVGKFSNLKSVKNKILFIKKDIRNFNQIKKYFKNIDSVIHLAALADIVPSIDNPDNYYSSNVTGTYNVVKACKIFNVKRFIYAASSSCYGVPKKYPTNEDSKVNPIYPYALTKRLGEELALHFGKLYKINTTSLRFFNVYGPRARTSGTYGAAFGVFLGQKLAGKPLTVVGNGKQTRDFTFISDVVDALVKVANSKKLNNEILNVGSGKTVSINKIVSLLGGKRIKIPKRPGEPQITFADIKKIKNKIFWKPKVDIQKGVRIMLKNINDWKDAHVWSPKKIEKVTRGWFKYLK